VLDQVLAHFGGNVDTIHRWDAASGVLRLAAHRGLPEAKEPAQEGPAVRQTMQHWQQDTDFNGVRGDAALAKLPEAERQEWQKLWRDVEALERRAADSK
jgi:hypothetical protein